MRKILSIFVVLFVLVGLTPVVKAQEPNERVIVLFKTKADKNLVVQAKGSVNREYKNVNAFSAAVPASAIKGLKNNPNIAAVEPDVVVKVKQQTIDWGVNRTAAPIAWSSSYSGKGVKVAVVDSGIASHDDLVIAGGVSFTSYTTAYFDDNGHGTHVAGIIGARNNGYGVVGVAPEASLYAVKVLGSDGSGYLSDVIAGIDWAITNKMDIINLSLGTNTASTTLQQEMDKAYSQGVLVVAAAGNDGTADGSGDTVDYPAKYDSVIAVAATDANDQRAAFSSTGSTVEVAAPGVNILSTYLNNQYASMSGTSMAAPFAAGNLALLKQANPTLSPAELRTKLRESVIDLGTSGRDAWYGYGLIQAPKQAQTPVTSQPVLLETRTTVITNKATYLAGENIYITVKATDSTGKAIPGAAIKLTITPPKGTATITKGTTGQSGSITFVMSTKRTSTKGTYQVLANTSYSGYSGSSASASFQIR